MVKTETSVVINRPIEKVFAFVTDIETHLQWQSGIQEAKVISESPEGVGSQYTYVMQILGQQVETTGEVTEYEPPSKQAWKSTSGPFPLKGGFTFEAVEGGTKVTSITEAEADGFFKLAEPLVVRMVQRQMQTSLDNLKDLLEAEA